MGYTAKNNNSHEIFTCGTAVHCNKIVQIAKKLQQPSLFIFNNAQLHNRTTTITWCKYITIKLMTAQ